MVGNVMELQNATELEKEVRDIIGLKKWIEISNASTSNEKIKIITDFILDVFGMFFTDEDENALKKLGFQLDILTSLPDENFEMTPEIMNTVMEINSIMEKSDMMEEIQANIKTLLVYILDLMENN